VRDIAADTGISVNRAPLSHRLERERRIEIPGRRSVSTQRMEMLCHLGGLYALGKIFDSDGIHRLLIEELMPDDVDMALSYFLHRCYDGSAYTLAILIFHAMLLRYEVCEDMLRAHFQEWFENRAPEDLLCRVTVHIRVAS